MKRREFIQISSASAAINTLVNSPSILENKMNKNDLIILATNWGFTGTIESFCQKIKAEGYDGAEIWFPDTQSEQDDLFSTFKDYDLKLGLLCGVGYTNADEHHKEFVKILKLATKNNHSNLIYVNCHSGKDFFDFKHNKKIIEASNEIKKMTGIPIYHETHRGRILFNIPITMQFINEIPDLELTLDISHWCNVHESLLEDQNESVIKAINRTSHVHARIGHAQGPQVSDPRAPEWQYTLNKHFSWWDEVVKQRANNNKSITFLTEFGPPDYMPTLPYTKQPVSDLWDINTFMLRELRKRYRN
jgi:sugar phosphate isomerase/epimerase